MKIHYKLYDYTDKQINRSISQLYRRIFGVNMDENLSFIFYPNPFGAPIGIIAQNEGQQVVGHFATMATAASVDSIRIPGRISFGFMVDDDYQGMHIASTMSDKLFAHLDERRECQFVIGFPNENSYHMHISVMGYRHLRDMQMVVLPKKTTAGKDQKGFYPIEVFHINEEGRPGNHVCHTQEMLSWRFTGNGYMKFQSKDGETFACNRYKDSMQILYWSSSVSEGRLIDFAGFLYEKYNVSAVRTWNGVSWLEKYPEENRKWHFCINVLPIAEKISDRLVSNWTFFPGDCELF